MDSSMPSEVLMAVTKCIAIVDDSRLEVPSAAIGERCTDTMRGRE